MTSRYVLVAALIACAPTLAAAQTPAPAATPAAAAKDAQSERVCRKESETGSLVRKRKVCRTRAEWDALAQASRDRMSEGQMSGSSSGN